MPKLDNIKRIIKEEYDEEIRPTIERLAYVINPFMESVVNLIAYHLKNYDYKNLY